MTDPLNPDHSDTDDLQFEDAEYASARPESLTCSACRNAIAESYFEIQGKVVCPRCQQGIAAQFAGKRSLVRFLRASLYGSAAAFVGAAIYFAVLKFTGVHAALISILVGLMVGGAVRRGARHRGGWLYQALAMLLTYSAIGASYGALALPDILAQLNQKQPVKQGIDAAVAAKPEGAKPAAAPPVAKLPPLTLGSALGRLALVLLFLIALTLGSPVLYNLDSPIGLLIIGFGLWEAWKLNRRPKLVFTGPFLLAPTADASAAEHDVHG